MSQKKGKTETKESGKKKVADDDDVKVENCREHVWFHRPRLPEKEESSTCFICCKGKKERGVGDLWKCSIDGCNVHFHEFCIEEDYNAADYSASSLKNVAEINNHKKKTIDGSKNGSKKGEGYQCPSHHCSECWNEKKKSSAVVGTMVECSDCYRGFHKECAPAATELVTVKRNGRKIEMAKCHQHGPIKPISKAQRTKFCYVCLQKRRQIKQPKIDESPSKKKTKLDEADGDKKKSSQKKKYVTKEEEMKECLGCMRVFHERCFDKEIKGARVEGAWCSKCVEGVAFSAGSHVINYYPGESAFYPCTVISLDKVLPKVKAYFSKGSRNFYGVAHKIPIQWAGVTNIQGFVDSSSVIQMFEGSRPLFMMENDQAFTDAWDEFERSHRRIGPDQTKMRTLERKAFTKIESSVYHKSVDFTTVYRFEEADDYVCECKSDKKSAPRCNDNSTCHNLSMDLECPPSCWEGTRAGKCANNDMQLKANCKDVQVRITKDKGHGVFATANIPKGTFIAEYAGEIISKEEKADRMESSTQRDNSEEHHYMMDIGDGLTIDCKRKGNDARFINHSCEPNCKAQIKSIPIKCLKDRIMYGQRVGIYAIRDIKAGDELSFFYAMTAYEEGTLPPPCYCGTASCGKYLGRVRGKEDEKENKKKTPKSTKAAKAAVKRKRSTSLLPRGAAVPAKRAPCTPAAAPPTATTKSGRAVRSISRAPPSAARSKPQTPASIRSPAPATIPGTSSAPRSAARSLDKTAAEASDTPENSTPATPGSVKKRAALQKAQPHSPDVQPSPSSHTLADRRRSITTSESPEAAEVARGSNEGEPRPSPSITSMEEDACVQQDEERRRSSRSIKKRVIFSPSAKGASPKKKRSSMREKAAEAAEEAAAPSAAPPLLTSEETDDDRQSEEINEEVLPELQKMVEERERAEESMRSEEEEGEKREEEMEKSGEEKEKREEEKREEEKREEEQAEKEDEQQKEMKEEEKEEDEKEIPPQQEEKIKEDTETTSSASTDYTTPEEIAVKVEKALGPTANGQAQESTEVTDGSPEL